MVWEGVFYIGLYTTRLSLHTFTDLPTRLGGHPAPVQIPPPAWAWVVAVFYDGNKYIATLVEDDDDDRQPAPKTGRVFTLAYPCGSTRLGRADRSLIIESVVSQKRCSKRET